MAKRQTRRSVSVKGLTYQRLKNYCGAQEISVSSFIEGIIAERLEGLEPVPDAVEPRPVPPEPAYQGNHFTF